MFLSIPVISEGFIIHVDLNVIHITSLEKVNPRNPKSGSLIFLIDGRMWESELTTHEIRKQASVIIEQFGNQILVSYLAEQMPQPKKKPVKKTNSKTVKY